MILDFIKYWLKAKNAHGIHSPFVFDFYNLVLNNPANADIGQDINTLRKKLSQDKTLITIQDFGAGSRHTKNNQRTIASIAKHSAKDPKWAQLFSAIIKHYNYKNIFDLGTSLGITTAYLGQACTDGIVHTFEGCAETLKIAKTNLDSINISNVKYWQGNIDFRLPEAIKDIDSLDFVFFDANHQFQPTIDYFEICLPKATETACFVFDDIYWSEGMKQAWQKIKANPKVTVSIDLFYVGIVFFNPKLKKQDFVLK